MTFDCPTHKKPMFRRATKYGPMYICTMDCCDMLKWGDSELTTVADTNTRASRHVAHQVFDKLWQDGHMSRAEAYQKLAEHLGTRCVDTHIGLFEIEECEETVRFANREQKRILLEEFK